MSYGTALAANIVLGSCGTTPVVRRRIAETIDEFIADEVAMGREPTDQAGIVLASVLCKVFDTIHGGIITHEVSTHRMN